MMDDKKEKFYRVSYEIDVYASSPEDAATQVAEIVSETALESIYAVQEMDISLDSMPPIGPVVLFDLLPTEDEGENKP